MHRPARPCIASLHDIDLADCVLWGRATHVLRRASRALCCPQGLMLPEDDKKPGTIVYIFYKLHPYLGQHRECKYVPSMCCICVYNACAACACCMYPVSMCLSHACCTSF